MTMTTIAKRFTFDAAHFLPTVPEHHKCHRMHGHTYVVELRFTATTDASGFCGGIDYGDIGAVWTRVDAKLDHRTLNDVPGLEVPTTEVLVEWIARSFIAECGDGNARLRAHLSSVRVHESSSTWCEYEVVQSDRGIAILLHGDDEAGWHALVGLGIVSPAKALARTVIVWLSQIEEWI